MQNRGHKAAIHARVVQRKSPIYDCFKGAEQHIIDAYLNSDLHPVFDFNSSKKEKAVFNNMYCGIPGRRQADMTFKQLVDRARDKKCPVCKALVRYLTARSEVAEEDPGTSFPPTVHQYVHADIEDSGATSLAEFKGKFRFLCAFLFRRDASTGKLQVQLTMMFQATLNAPSEKMSEAMLAGADAPGGDAVPLVPNAVDSITRGEPVTIIRHLQHNHAIFKRVKTNADVKGLSNAKLLAACKGLVDIYPVGEFGSLVQITAEDNIVAVHEHTSLGIAVGLHQPPPPPGAIGEAWLPGLEVERVVADSGPDSGAACVECLSNLHVPDAVLKAAEEEGKVLLADLRAAEQAVHKLEEELDVPAEARHVPISGPAQDVAGTASCGLAPHQDTLAKKARVYAHRYYGAFFDVDEQFAMAMYANQLDERDYVDGCIERHRAKKAKKAKEAEEAEEASSAT